MDDLNVCGGIFTKKSRWILTTCRRSTSGAGALQKSDGGQNSKKVVGGLEKQKMGRQGDRALKRDGGGR